MPSNIKGILDIRVEHVTWEYVKELNEYKFLSEKISTHACTDDDRINFSQSNQDFDENDFFTNYGLRFYQMQCVDSLERLTLAGKIGDTFG